MNIALASIIIILFLMPGVIFIRSYSSGLFSDGFKVIDRLDNLSTPQLIIRAIIPSLIIHFGFSQICMITGWGKINFQLLFGLLIGGKIASNFVIELSDNIESENWQVIIYNTAINVTALSIGFAAKIIVRVFRLDRKFEILRYPNDWHYIFSGEILEISGDIKGAARDQIDLRYVTVCVDIGGQAVVIAGVLESYKLSPPNEVQFLILSNARRRPLDWDAAPGQQGTEDFYKLPGNYLIIPFHEIKNLEIEYICLDKIAQAEGDAGDPNADQALT